MATTFQIAIIDMYDGTPNVGMACIGAILEDWSRKNNITVSINTYNLREHCALPDMRYDIYISTGGPGSPLDSKGSNWDNLYTEWLEKALEQKKWLLLICHSFQIACRHFNIGSISLRRKRQIGILPVHPLIQDSIFNGLNDPFYTLESRYYQITEPNDIQIEKMGAAIIALEKERPTIPLERAIMGVKFNEQMYGVQFHPEGAPQILNQYFNDPTTKQSIINEFGLEKWEGIMKQLEDDQEIEQTFSHFIPNFLNKAIGK